MNAGQLKEMLADVGDDLPVMVKTAEGWKHVILACEEILWTEKTPPGVETEAFFLELVTPVEELEPYHINEIFDIDDGKLIGYEVAHGDTRESIFYGGETHLRSIEKAKERADAECHRLNAEYSKEQSNG